MGKMFNKLLYWFCGTWLGAKYLEFLLWLDDKDSKPDINTRAVNEIVMEAQQMLYKEGIGKIKKTINSIVTARTKEEYEAKLKMFEDLIPLAERDDENLKHIKEALYSAHIKRGKDVKTAKDFAKMVDSKIEYTKQMWEQKERRELSKRIRQAKKVKDLQLAEELEKEFFTKYGR